MYCSYLLLNAMIMQKLRFSIFGSVSLCSCARCAALLADFMLTLCLSRAGVCLFSVRSCACGAHVYETDEVLNDQTERTFAHDIPTNSRRIAEAKRCTSSDNSIIASGNNTSASKIAFSCANANEHPTRSSISSYGQSGCFSFSCSNCWL